MFQLITVTLPQIQFGFGVKGGWALNCGKGEGWKGGGYLKGGCQTAKHHKVHKERYDMTKCYLIIIYKLCKGFQQTSDLILGCRQNDNSK